MKKRLGMFLFVLCLSNAFADTFDIGKPEQVGISSERLERLDSVMQGFIDNGELTGFVTLIARHGHIVQFKAYGYRDLENQAPMEKDALFRLYSMTKPVTCTAMMILVEEGEILLSDPISKYLPQFKNRRVLIEEKGGEIVTVPAESEITIQQLATHTSGLAYEISKDISPTLFKKVRNKDVYNPNHTIEELSEFSASLPLLHQPGTHWQYCDASMDLIARLVEMISGQKYGDFLHERIFKPLKMNDTAYAAPEKDWDRVACLYEVKEGKLVRNLDHEEYYTLNIRQGGGDNLLSSTMDYARFAQMLANGGELEGARILSPQSVKRMSTDLIRNEENCNFLA